MLQEPFIDLGDAQMSAIAPICGDSVCHAAAVRKMLTTVVRCVQADLHRVAEPKGHELLQRTVRTLEELAADCRRYEQEQRSEPAAATIGPSSIPYATPARAAFIP